LSEELYGLPPLLRFACLVHRAGLEGFLSLFDGPSSIICGYDVMMVDDGWMHGTSVADDYNTTTRKDLNNYYKLDCRVDGLE
jgi:hypothetical protein